MNTNPASGVKPDSVQKPDSAQKPDSIVASVVASFKQRSEIGIKKYGVTLDRTDLSLLDWVQHTQEDLMDAVLYLEKLKKTLTLTS